MPTAKNWLETLTLDKLHRVATAVGAPCSGVKRMRIEGIQRAVLKTEINHGSGIESSGLSLLSIDMGIRNLAFAHITAPRRKPTDSAKVLQYDTPTLRAWQRIEVTNDASRSSEGGRESFEPIDYARHAYKLVKTILETYQPSHILIERQRFRSGGGSAVQEWTIRVGVFEGMLYSVLRTLTEESKMELSVEPMQPPRVNRYWLESPPDQSVPASKKPTGRDVKKAKIELVAAMLKKGEINLRVAQDLKPFVNDFLLACESTSTKKRVVANGLLKLDDLADSLLQGLAFIGWQNNRERLRTLGQDAIDLGTGDLV